MKKFCVRSIVSGFCMFASFVCTAQHLDTIILDYEQTISKWHEQRINNLKREHGWLSLVALEWLSEGKNTFPFIGTLNLHDGRVKAETLPEINATVEGKPFTKGILRTDADSLGPDKVFLDSRAFIIIKRGEKFAMRLWDGNSDLRKKFAGIERYPIFTKWRIKAKWRTYAKPKKISIASVISGIEEESSVPGIAIFSIDGIECRLEPLAESGDKEYFFLFKDKTNGNGSYGAGRFLYASAPVDSTIILDFNKAYNPPCAFTPYATCPLPPPENRLKVRIEAGEKDYGHH